VAAKIPDSIDQIIREWISDGRSNRDIAEGLEIAFNTVKSRRADMRRTVSQPYCACGKPIWHNGQGVLCSGANRRAMPG
jgi:hypothetical protein